MSRRRREFKKSGINFHIRLNNKKKFRIKFCKDVDADVWGQRRIVTKRIHGKNGPRQSMTRERELAVVDTLFSRNGTFN